MFSYKGKKVLIWGLGEFHGGAAATEFLLSRGADVTVTDTKTEEELQTGLRTLSQFDIHYTLGRHDFRDFENADIIVVNPAVKFDHPWITLLKKSGKWITSEIELFLSHCPTKKIVAVTGSAGKSTTTTLIHRLISEHGIKAHLGGNIGHSLLNENSAISVNDWVVLELSSFQLHQLKDFPFTPLAAVVTNFFPNHLDWHKSVVHYLNSKQVLTRYQTGSHFFIRPESVEVQTIWPGNALRIDPEDLERIFLFDNHTVSDGLKLPGKFNNLNAKMAIATVMSLGFQDRNIIQKVLSQFTGLPHRMELLYEVNGIRFINDSKSTTPESTIAALDHSPCDLILLAGGADKGVDLKAMAKQIAHHVSLTILMGETGEKLAEFIRSVDESHPIYIAKSSEEAFYYACSNAKSGSTVLLSPGCASFGWFKNFEHRGDSFRDFIQRYFKLNIE